MCVCTRSMPPYFIDFEAFQHGDGDFEVKELCMVDVDKPFGKHLYLLFRPSGEWYNLEHGAQCTYNYQTQHLRRLGWYEGVTPYCRYLVLHEITKYFPMFSKQLPGCAKDAIFEEGIWSCYEFYGILFHKKDIASASKEHQVS